MDYLLPLIILVARVIETTLETLRLIYISKSHRYLASVIGAVKIGIWILATGLVLTNLENIPAVLAYMAGYGIGTLLGMTVESWIGLGTAVVWIFCANDPDPFIRHLGSMGYGTTRINGSGQFVPAVAVLLSIVPRKELPRLLMMLRNEYPDILFTTEEVSSMSEREVFFGKGTGRAIRRWHS